MDMVVFATAPNQMIAEMWCDIVQQAGFECRIRPGDVTGFMGVSETPVRLIPREDQEEQAKAALDAVIQNADDEPGEEDTEDSP